MTRSSVKRKYDDLTCKQKRFVDLVCQGHHTIGECYAQAGFSVVAAEQNGWNLYRKLKGLIEARQRELVEANMSAVVASEVVNQIMRDEAVNPQVRLNAAKDIMSRAGFDRPQELNINHTVDEMTEDEIAAELRGILSGLEKPELREDQELESGRAATTH